MPTLQPLPQPSCLTCPHPGALQEWDWGGQNPWGLLPCRSPRPTCTRVYTGCACVLAWSRIRCRSDWVAQCPPRDSSEAEASFGLTVRTGRAGPGTGSGDSRLGRAELGEAPEHVSAPRNGDFPPTFPRTCSGAGCQGVFGEIKRSHRESLQIGQLGSPQRSPKAPLALRGPQMQAWLPPGGDQA